MEQPARALQGQGKRSMCWQAMGETLNASASEVRRKIHNLRCQVFLQRVFCELTVSVLYLCESDFISKLPALCNVNVQTVLPSKSVFKLRTGR